ncbi:MAG TPA: hypothetical protein VGC45_02525 [Gryllotalpicola sp.]
MAVGYVLGARAGRKRYDQIASAADKVWQSPGIQKQVHAAQDFAAARIGDIPGAVFDGARKAATGAINLVQTKTTGSSPKSTPTKAPKGGADVFGSQRPPAETVSDAESEPLGG